MANLDMSDVKIPVGTVVHLEAVCSCGEVAGRDSIIMEEEPRGYSFYGRCPATPFHQLRVTASYNLPVRESNA